jgi:hypothetical protein
MQAYAIPTLKKSACIRTIGCDLKTEKYYASADVRYQTFDGFAGKRQLFEGVRAG